MTHREVLLEAILDDPADDLPRLAYADVCEEEVDLLRAEFIKSSVQHGKYVELTLPKLRMINLLLSDVRVAGVEESLARSIRKICWWIPPNDMPMPDQPTLFFWRGFVREVALTQDSFLQHAEALFNAHPIERVRLIDRVPAEWVPASERSVPVFSWHYDLRLMDTPSYLAVPIWSRLDCEEMHAAFKRYRSRGEANQALEVATLAWGKSLRKSKCSG